MKKKKAVAVKAGMAVTSGVSTTKMLLEKIAKKRFKKMIGRGRNVVSVRRTKSSSKGSKGVTRYLTRELKPNTSANRDAEKQIKDAKTG